MVRGAVDGVLLAVAEGPMLTRGVILTALACPGDAATTVTLGVTELYKQSCSTYKSTAFLLSHSKPIVNYLRMHNNDSNKTLQHM